MTDLFPGLTAGPPGFALLEDVLTPAEEATLLAWVDPRPLPDGLRGRAALGGVETAAIAQALVSRYPAGAGIGWHRDRAMYGPVVGCATVRRELARGSSPSHALRAKASDGTGGTRQGVAGPVVTPIARPSRAHRSAQAVTLRTLRAPT